MTAKCNNCINQKGEYNISSTTSGYWCCLRNNPVDRTIAVHCDKFHFKPPVTQ
jgi:hypothetical protein